MDNQKLAIHLIGEQIRNKLLMTSFEELGFDCSTYTLNISEEILTLTGFQKKPDSLYQWYFDLIDNAIEETTYWNLDEMLEKWAVKIYSLLLDMNSKGSFL